MSPRLCPALLAPLVLAAACSGVFQTHEAAPVVYVLHPVPPAAATQPPLAATLVVARPAARPGLDGERIAVRLADRRLDAYAGAEWGAPVPQLVEALLVDAFRATGTWQAVVTDRSAFPGRYLLQAEVTDFAADYTAGGPPLVRVELRGELGRAADRRLVATVAGRGEVRAAADRQREVAAAFEAAAGHALGEVVAAAEAAARAAEAAVPAR